MNEDSDLAQKRYCLLPEPIVDSNRLVALEAVKTRTENLSHGEALPVKTSLFNMHPICLGHGERRPKSLLVAQPTEEEAAGIGP